MTVLHQRDPDIDVPLDGPRRLNPYLIPAFIAAGLLLTCAVITVIAVANQPAVMWRCAAATAVSGLFFLLTVRLHGRWSR